jgi:elongation factor G
MAVYVKDKIRNIAIIGHSGEGKTSLLEAILFKTKMTERLGKVDEGNTVSDFDQEEINRKMSISMSVAYALYKGHKFNFIDVPGFFDFEGEMVAALTAADCALIVASASGQVTVGAEKAIEYCESKGIPMFIFINGVNKENSDYFKTVDAFRQKYGNKVTPLELPIMKGYDMTGYVNAALLKAFDNDGKEIAIPDSLVGIAEEYNMAFIEFAAEANDELLEKFFSGEELTQEEKMSGLKKRIMSAELIPVVAGVAVGKPVLAGLLDNIISLFPSPVDMPAKKATDQSGKELEVVCDENGAFAAQIFKTVVDKFIGKVQFFKVASGKVKVGDVIYNTDKNESEKVSALLLMKGNKNENADVLQAGDIGAFAKLNYTSTGDTLCAPSDKIKMAAIEYPEPVFAMAVTSAEKGKEDKVFGGLSKLLEEDPTFRLEKNLETNEMLIHGMGESQIEILCRKLKNKEGVEAKLTEPKVPYRETIRKTVEQQGKYKKQSGGHGQYGDVYIRFEPKPEVDFEFDDEIVGGVVPKQYIPAVEKGLRECITKGVLAGYPVVGMRAVLYFGSYHSVDSSELAFKMAASIAYKDGLPKANPVLLEPIMSISVTIPESYMGDIMGDLNKRRGRIFGMETVNGRTVVKGEVPQGEIFKYATDLRSMTQGRGKFSVKFERYEEAPMNIAQKVIEEYNRAQNNG